MERIPVLTMGELLMVTIQVDMHDRLARTLLDDVAEAISAHGMHGVLIDISALDVVDTFIGRTLSTIAATAQVLGAETVMTGMQPAVAITLVELGLSMPGIRTALNAARGMAMLEAALDDQRESADGSGRGPDA